MKMVFLIVFLNEIQDSGKSFTLQKYLLITFLNERAYDVRKPEFEIFPDTFLCGIFRKIVDGKIR